MYVSLIELNFNFLLVRTFYRIIVYLNSITIALLLSPRNWFERYEISYKPSVTIKLKYGINNSKYVLQNAFISVLEP